MIKSKVIIRKTPRGFWKVVVKTGKRETVISVLKNKSDAYFLRDEYKKILETNPYSQEGDDE